MSKKINRDTRCVSVPIDRYEELLDKESRCNTLSELVAINPHIDKFPTLTIATVLGEVGLANAIIKATMDDREIEHERNNYNKRVRRELQKIQNMQSV